MADLARTDDIFFNRANLDRDQTERLVAESLNGADDGELFLEYRQSESLAYDDGRLKTAAFDTSQGFGLRAIAGEARGFAFASDLSLDAIRRAAKTVTAVTDGHSGSLAAA
ncbi:MAG: DNA gyrase modulator, partial [Pseudomonadota bacterium]|nr:DNA gyrase modulator [Pseudomonadota bacterium]